MNNTSIGSPHISRTGTFQPIFHTLLVVLSVLITAQNVIIICLYLKNACLRKETTNYLCANLAVGDLLTGLGMIPLTIASASLSRRNNVHMIALYFTANVASDFITIYTNISICLVMYNRFMILRHPYSANSDHHVKARHIVSAVILSIVIALIPIAWNYNLLADETEPTKYYQEMGDKIHSLSLILLFFFLPSCLVLAGLIVMFREVKSSLNEESQNRIDNPDFFKQQLAVVLRFSSAFMAFLICWIPLMLIRTLVDFNVVEFINSRVLEVIFALRCCTSIFNPFAYTWCNPAYKKALLKCRLVKLMRRCRDLCRNKEVLNSSSNNNDSLGAQNGMLLNLDSSR